LKHIKDARDFLLILFIFIRLIKLLFSFEICEQRKSSELLFCTCSYRDENTKDIRLS